MFAVQDLRSSSGVFVAGTRLIAMDVVTLPENNAFQCGSVAFRVLDERSAWMHDRGDPRVDTFLSESLRFRKTLTENDRIRDYLDTRIQNLGGSGGGKLGGESNALPLTYSEQKPKTVAPPGTRFLDLSRIPPDAELIVNGQVVRTRGIVAVPIGEHDVLIEQGFLRKRHKKIVVTEGEEPFELR